MTHHAPRSRMPIVNQSDWDLDDLVRIVTRVEESIDGDARLVPAIARRPGAVSALRRAADGTITRVPPPLTFVRMAPGMETWTLAWRVRVRQGELWQTIALADPRRIRQNPLRQLLAAAGAPIAPDAMVRTLGLLLQGMYTYWHTRTKGMFPHDADLTGLALRPCLRRRRRT